MLKKKLFFNLRKAKGRIGALEEGDLHPENVKKIADELKVSEDEVVNMNRRLNGGDASLNSLITNDSDGSNEWQDWLEDDINHANEYAEKEELDARKKMLLESFSVLNNREKHIIFKRRLTDSPLTLEDLSKRYKVSRERIRQIELKAFEKLKNKIKGFL